jgi:hypothetical protein
LKLSQFNFASLPSNGQQRCWPFIFFAPTIEEGAPHLDFEMWELIDACRPEQAHFSGVEGPAVVVEALNFPNNFPVAFPHILCNTDVA